MSKDQNEMIKIKIHCFECHLSQKEKLAAVSLPGPD